MSKPREFWGNWMTLESTLESAKDQTPKAEWIDIKCFVEKSSYAALEARCKKLEAALAGAVTLFQTNWKCDTCVQVNKDCYKLLVEALAQDEVKDE